MITNGVMDEKITIEQLAEDIEELIWKEGIEKFEVEEHLESKKDYYIACGLNVEYEDGVVYCNDSYDMIHKNGYELMNLFDDRIIHIYRFIGETERYGVIQLKDGYIKINVIYE